MLEIGVRHGALLTFSAACVIGGGLAAYGQEFFLPSNGSSTYQSPVTAAPQLQSGAQVEQYLNPGGLVQLPPPALFATDIGPTAGRFPLAQSQPTIVTLPTIENRILISGGGAGTQLQGGGSAVSTTTGDNTGGAAPSAGSNAISIAGTPAADLVKIRTQPIQIIPLPEQPPILVPVDPGGVTIDGNGGMTLLQPQETMPGQDAGGTTPPPEASGSSGGGATATEEQQEASSGMQGSEAAGVEQQAEQEEQQKEEQQEGAAAEGSNKVSHAAHDDEEAEKERKRRKKEEEYAATLRAMDQMSQAKQEAESHLGFNPIADPTGAHTQVEHQQIMGAEVMGQIQGLAQSLQGGVQVASLPQAVDVLVDEAEIKRRIAKERARIEKEKQRLKKEAERERKRLEREKRKADREAKRREGKEYRERKAREEQQRKLAEDLNKENKDLKDRADKLDKQQKDFDRIDKELREQEQKARANDPNCQGAECRGIREQRAELNQLKTQNQKDQAKLQKDGQAFNNKVRDWQADQRALDDLKDRGFGMDEAERAAHNAEKRTLAAQDQLRSIEQQKADLKRQAKWLEAEGELDEEAANDLRKQWKALEGAEQKAQDAVRSAEADLLEKQASALGAGDLYKEATKNLKPEDRPTKPWQVPGLEDAMDEARRYQEASDETLERISKAYGDAIETVNEIERKIGAMDPKDQPPVIVNGPTEYAQKVAEFNKLADELKALNPQGYMATSAWRDAVKAEDAAEKELLKHQFALEELGDSEALHNDWIRRGQGEPIEFRSEAELARRHSFSYTGPESLRDEVMQERAALEKATADYLGVQDQMTQIREGSPAYQKGQELWKKLDALDSQIDALRPLADVNALSDDVLQFNAHLSTGLPRGADGEIDEQAVIRNVKVMSAGQMALLQNGVALDQAEHALQANPNGQAEAKQVGDLKAQQQTIVRELNKTGLNVKITEDGKYDPGALTSGVGEMWNMARDQTVATLDQIARNRAAAGIAGGASGQIPPKAGKGAIDGRIDGQFRQAEAERAELDKVADAGAPPDPEAARSEGHDLSTLWRAQSSLDMNIRSLDESLAELPKDHPIVPALTATKTSLEAARKGVDAEIVKTQKRAEETALRTKQLTEAAEIFKGNIAGLDTAIAGLPAGDPVAAGLSAARDSLKATLGAVNTAMAEGQKKKSETVVRTENIHQAQEALRADIEGIDAALQGLPGDHPVVPALTATKAGLESALKGVESAIVRTEQGEKEIQERTRQLKSVAGALDKNITAIDGRLTKIDPWTPEAVALAATKGSLQAARIGIDQALKEVDVRPIEGAPQPVDLPDAGTTTVAAKPATLSPELKDSLVENRAALARQIGSLEQQIVAAGPDSVAGAALQQTQTALKASLEVIDKTLKGPVASGAPPPQPVAVTQPEPAATKPVTRPDRLAIVTANQEKVTRQRQAIRERLKSLPPDDPEAAKLRETLDQLGDLQQELDNELEKLSPSEPAAAANDNASQEKAGAAPPEAASARADRVKAIEGDPQLVDLRRQIFELDRKAQGLQPGTSDWQAYMNQRNELMGRYYTRYTAAAQEQDQKAGQSGGTPPQAATTPAPEKAATEPDPMVSYLEWVERDILPVLRGSVGQAGLRQALLGIGTLLGAAQAEAIVDGALDRTLEFGDGNSAEIFLDALLAQAAAAAREDLGAAAGRSIDLARAQALAGLLRDPAVARNAELKEELSARFAEVDKSLRDALGREVAAAVNKPEQKIPLLGELAVLSQLDGGDLGPLVTEFEKELERLGKAAPATGAAGAEREQVLRQLAGTLEALQATTPELADRLGKARLAGIRLLQQQVSTLAKNAPEERAPALKREAANLVLREAAALLGAGEPAAALDRIRKAETNQDLSPTERDLALLSALDRIRGGWEGLDANAKTSLTSLEAVEKERDEVLQRLSQGNDRALASAASLMRARGAAAKGDRARAAAIIDEAIQRQPDDPVLRGEKLRLALSGTAQEPVTGRVDRALADIPPELRLPAGLLAVDALLENGTGAAALALIEKLRGMGEAVADPKALNALLDARKAHALAGQSADSTSNTELRQSIAQAKESLGEAAKSNPALAGEVERLDALSKQLDQVEALEKSLSSGAPPAEGYESLTKAALALGRVDLAEKALAKQIGDLLDGETTKDNAAVLAGLRNAGQLLEIVRRRAALPDLTVEQRALLEGLIGRGAPQLVAVIDRYIAERMPVTSQSLARALADQKNTATAAQRRNELRMLEHLRWRVQATLVPPDQLLARISEAEAAASQRVEEKLAEIRGKFGPRREAVNTDPTVSADLDKALAEVDALRAARDGITDFKLSFAPMPGNEEIDPRVRSYGPLLPKTIRDLAIRDAHEALIGVEPGGAADDLWERRREAHRQGVNYTAPGVRERLLVESGRKPSGDDYWLNLRMIERDVAYYERRRAELIYEDPARPGSAATELLNKLVGEEVKVLNGVVAPSNALSELSQKMSGYGQQFRDLSAQVAAQTPQNEINGWMADLEIARQGGDAQKAFSSLVKLRDASLSGEIDAFVNYLDMPWYRAGPARAYNLVIGMTETQTALEAAIVETSRLNAVLIRAANNLPEALSADDRTLLARHGFLEDGRYKIPEHVRVTPTDVATAFTETTQQGVLGKVDHILNAAHAAELTATVAIPGGIAGRLGRSFAKELTAFGLRSLTAQGVALAVETAAFTGLTRAAQAVMDPALLQSREFWSGKALLAEYGHNLLTLGVLKLKGAGLEKLGKSIEGLPQGVMRTQLEGAARSLDVVGEAALLTTLNGALSSNSISREGFFENLMVVSLLRATHAATDAGKEVLGLPTGEGPANPDWRIQQWLHAYYLPSRRLMEQFGGDWAAARKAYQKGELTAGQMRRLVDLRRTVVDSLTREILGELGGDVQAFGSTNLTSDYDISFVGPKAQLAVILFNARFGARWGAAIDIGGRESGVTLDTNAYTETAHLKYEGGQLDVWLQDSYAHLAARKYLDDAAWADYRARVEQAADPARRADIDRMLDKVDADFRDMRGAIEAEKARLKGSVAESDLNITAENRLYEKTLMEIADLMERHQRAAGAEKEALAQEIRNAQSRALFYAQEAYNTQAAIEHVVTTIQAAKRSITADTLLGKDPIELNVPLTADQARQSFIEQIANMMKELSHGGDPAKLAGKAAKYFVRALDAAKIAGIDLAALEGVVRATVEINDKRAEIKDVTEALKQHYQEGGAEAYLADVNKALDALNRAFFGGAQARTAANDNAAAAGPAEGTQAAAEPVSTESAPSTGTPAPAGGGTAPVDSKADTLLDTLPGNAPAGSDTVAGNAPSAPADGGGVTEAQGAARAAYNEGLRNLEGDPVFARWLDQAVTSVETRRQLAMIGLLRGMADPVDRLQADVALATAEGLINNVPELAGIDLLEVAKYVNLHAGRVVADGSAAAEAPLAAQLAVEALLQINPTARIRIADLTVAARIDGARARAALNGARSVIARQSGELTDPTDSFDRHPVTSFTENPFQVLNRLDGSYLVQRPRAETPGDADFFAANDLLPRLTIEVGGHRFHLTEPFRAAKGRIAVVAFQETSLGTVVPRTFYLSGEHGVWRAAVAMAGGLISKGPLRLVYGEREITMEQWMEMGVVADTNFINESAVDLGAEIQGVLSRWSMSRGVRELPVAVADRAFYGNLEQGNNLESGAEFSAFVARQDVERPWVTGGAEIPEPLRPDFLSGPLDRWQMNSPLYGLMEGATYQSRDGSVIYVVLRDARGRVFVPSIQDAKVGLTPFGTRWSAYQTDLNSTPMRHGAADYVANDNYENALNRLFR